MFWHQPTSQCVCQARALTPSGHAEQGSRSNMCLHSLLPLMECPSLLCPLSLNKHTHTNTQVCTHSHQHPPTESSLHSHSSLPLWSPSQLPHTLLLKTRNSSNDELDANVSFKITWYHMLFQYRFVHCLRRSSLSYLSPQYYIQHVFPDRHMACAQQILFQ